MLSFDTRNLDTETREKLAWKVRNSKDFKLPELNAWNYDLCRVHRAGWTDTVWDAEAQQDREITVFDRPPRDCRKCGIIFHKHQRVSIAWLYLRKRALLADTMGTGKTTSAAGLIAMLLQTGELADKRYGGMGRAIITPRSPALHQWHSELLRMMPGLNVVMAEGPAALRKQMYLSEWQVLLIGPEMLLNDYKLLERFDLAAFITDDVDSIRNPDNKQANILKKMGRHADRMVMMTGTPIQKNLKELHSVLDPIGGLEVFGPISSFESKYIKKEYVSDYDPKTGKKTKVKQVTGYRNLAEVKKLMAPMVLRRTAEDLDDVTMPSVLVNDVMLDLYPIQRAKYQELQTGVLRIAKEEGLVVKHTTAMTQLHYGAQICGGLATLGEPDGPGTSVKLDWIISKLGPGGELENEKVVIFANYKNTVRALHERFREIGRGFVTVWGDDPNKANRRKAQELFWEHPKCSTLIGTRAIEQSLNLQVSRHLINVDMIMNPARMEQLAGRVRRDGSKHKHVYVHNLLAIDTQEERYLPALEREAALSSHIWDEESPLFSALNPVAMLQLITG